MPEPIDPASLTPEQRKLWDDLDFGTLKPVNEAGTMMTPAARDAEFRYICSFEGVGAPS